MPGARTARAALGVNNALLSLILAASVFLAQPPSALSAQPDLPLEARRAMRLGLEAVKVKEWSLAIDYFSQAQRAAPKHPQALYNLALAYDASGRDLLAIIWYRAYLAAAPKASNAAQIRARLLQLDNQVKDAISKLLSAVEEMAAEGLADKKVAYYDIVDARVALGDFDGALKTASRLQQDPDSAHFSTALAQARSGDIAAAMKTAGYIRRPDFKSHVYGAIVEALAKAGDVNEALGIAKSTEHIYDRTRYHLHIALTLARVGKTAEAKKIWERVLALTDKQKEQEGILPEHDISDMAVALADAGDIAGAMLVAIRWPGYPEARHQKEYARSLQRACDWVALVQAQRDYQKEGGEKISDAPDCKGSGNASSYRAVGTSLRLARRLAEAGDLAGARDSYGLARKLVTDMQAHKLDKVTLYKRIALAQAGTGDLAGAEQTLALFLSSNLHPMAAEYFAPEDIANAPKAGSELNDWIWLGWWGASNKVSSLAVVDLNRLMENLKGGWAWKELARAAESMAEALKRIRDTQARWQKLRAKGGGQRH